MMIHLSLIQSQWFVLILPMRDWNRVETRLPHDFPLFWSYLWGIEIKKVNSFVAKNPCFDLTYEGLKSFPIPHHERLEYCFDLTYEGLKYLSGRYCGVRPRDVLILPMRDWNRQETCRLKGTPRVLILPMRDWNTKPNKQKTKHNPRFDLTYEGLKLIEHEKNFWENHVLILPMRDWNSVILQPSNNSGFCFDLTYEGLKYRITPPTFPSSSVLILPMRDWNIVFITTRHNASCVLILPMRDWNTQSWLN